MNSTQLVLLILSGYGILLLMVMATWMSYIVSMIRTNNKEREKKK